VKMNWILLLLCLCTACAAPGPAASPAAASDPSSAGTAGSGGSAAGSGNAGAAPAGTAASAANAGTAPAGTASGATDAGTALPSTAAPAGQGAGSGTASAASFSQGRAATVQPGLLACRGGRTSALGQIVSEDGLTWTVPAKVDWTMNAAGDVSNPCSGVIYRSIADVDVNRTPIVEVDPDGVVITGYFYADNYFELYVNGKAVARDPVPYTPFNVAVVRFKAKYPMTYAIRAVDWEENLGLGTENNRGNAYQYGDGGIVGVFSDGTVTDASWKAQSFYIAPLQSKADLTIERQGDALIHRTPDYNSPPSCNDRCYAAHFAVPDGWTAANFDDASWPQASAYSAREAGMDNKKEFTDYRDTLGKGQIIWSGNLNLDNEVLLRRNVEGPSAP